MAPLTGRHSVMDRPLSVSRVIPPTTIMAKTRAATASSQRDRAKGRSIGRALWLGAAPLPSSAAAGPPFEYRVQAVPPGPAKPEIEAEEHQYERRPPGRERV